MRKARYLLAATLVATALCADRAIAASPSARPDVVRLAERLVSRLSVSFGRAVATKHLFVQRQGGTVARIPQPITSDLDTIFPQPTSPFQFRLPPPELVAGC